VGKGEKGVELPSIQRRIIQQREMKLPRYASHKSTTKRVDG